MCRPVIGDGTSWWRIFLTLLLGLASGALVALGARPVPVVWFELRDGGGERRTNGPC
jgi:hypothetical protein